MVTEIVYLVFLLAFLILMYFFIQTLLSLQKAMHRAENLLLELELNVKRMEPVFKSISNVGDICEDKTNQLKRDYLEKKEAQCRSRSSEDLAHCSTDCGVAPAAPKDRTQRISF